MEDSTPDSNFALLEEALRSRGASGVFDLLTRTAREEKNYPVLFQARVMQKAHALGLPLIQAASTAEVPRQVIVEAARETGELALAHGDIERAWIYYEALDEPAPVAAAIETVRPEEASDRVMEIAFYKGVNQRKGFELILERRGVCGALTAFAQYQDVATRQESLRRLVRALHGDLAAALKRVINAAEEKDPETGSVSELIAGREWLFEGMNQYVDSTHVAAILPFSRDLEDEETLRLALELAEYGCCLGPLYHFRGDPPFEDIYGDHAIYLRALLGEKVEEAIAHFRKKIDPSAGPAAPAAEILIILLLRLGRYGEAIQVSIEHLNGAAGVYSGCPSASQLCQMAGDFEQLRDLAKRQGDVVLFAAGMIQAAKVVVQDNINCEEAASRSL